MKTDVLGFFDQVFAVYARVSLSALHFHLAAQHQNLTVGRTEPRHYGDIGTCIVWLLAQRRSPRAIVYRIYDST